MNLDPNRMEVPAPVSAIPGITLAPDLGSFRVFRRVEPYASNFVENSRYLLKSLDEMSELEEVMELRAKVFKEEYGASLASSSLDVDAYDFKCDHLIIKEKQTQRIVGTYRLLCSKFVDRFYSQSEFYLDEFLKTEGTKLELGRACIHPDHRRGATLNLLWRGIIRYAMVTDSEYLFGCSSLKTTDPFEAKAIHDSLKAQNLLSNDWNIHAIGKFKIDQFPEILSAQITQTPALPPLLRSYLNAGAKIYGDPALDRDFNCIDLITILRLKDLNQSHEKYYQM
jgi:putative hemolysin